MIVMVMMMRMMMMMLMMMAMMMVIKFYASHGDEWQDRFGTMFEDHFLSNFFENAQSIFLIQSKGTFAFFWLVLCDASFFELVMTQFQWWQCVRYHQLHQVSKALHECNFGSSLEILLSTIDGWQNFSQVPAASARENVTKNLAQLSDSNAVTHFDANILLHHCCKS